MKKKKVCDFKVLEYNNNLPTINLPGSQPYRTDTLTRLFAIDPDDEHPYCGVYFVSIMAFDPQGNKYYLVKVGSANDCEKRINQYFTYNPIIYTNNTYLHISDNIKLAETNCQAYLSQFADGIARGTHEWFHMSETNYFLMCDMFKDKTTFEMIARGEID